MILRTSPLAKCYGWGFLFDTDGRVKLCPMESEEYRELVEGGDVKVLEAMASSRRDLGERSRGLSRRVPPRRPPAGRGRLRADELPGRGPSQPA